MQCKGIKKNGEPCPKSAKQDSEFCQFHQPKEVKPEAKPADGMALVPCDVCFPMGWDGLPDDTTCAGCAHGTWNK